MIKKILKVAFTAFIPFILGTILSFNTAAADEEGYSIKIDNMGNVTLISDHEEKSGITALQFSLEVSAKNAADVSFEFNSENNFKISEYRYNAESNCLNIYISDSEVIFGDADSLDIGAVSAKDKKGSNLDVEVNVVEDSLKYVYQNVLINRTFDVTATTTAATTNTKPTVTTTTSVSTTTAKPATTTSNSNTSKPVETTTSAKPATTVSSGVTITNSSATTLTTISETETSATTTVSHIASDEEFCDWAIIDYKDKTGIKPAKAEITENSEGQYEISLTDESGNVLDTYVIDPSTGIGTNSANEEVNLPQTGNNSMTNIIIACGAFIIIIIGICAIKTSGIIRHKKDEQ